MTGYKRFCSPYQTMAYIQTIYPGYIPDDYFTKENVEYVQKKATELIHKDISTDVTIDTGSVVRILQRVLEQRLESIPKMNQRALMILVNSYLNYSLECNRNLWWADAYVAIPATIRSERQKRSNCKLDSQTKPERPPDNHSLLLYVVTQLLYLKTIHVNKLPAMKSVRPFVGTPVLPARSKE